MALTKSNSSLAQLTATGNTAAADISAGYATVFSIKHLTGTGTITTGGKVQPEISHDGGTVWHKDGGEFVFGLVASATEYRTYTPPTDGLAAKHVRFAWVVPVGSTGHTLDVEYTRVTAI